jgi:hypothetical protein
MNQVIKVTLEVIGNDINIDPDPVNLETGDQLVFVASDSNTYTVIIPADTHLSTSDYFSTTKSLIINDITGENPVLTPIPLSNIDTGPEGIAYTVIVTTSTNTFSTDPDAPPRIIIHT